MRPDYYILGDDGEPVAVAAMTWALWFETHHSDRVVLRTRPASHSQVSTVFLGLDHAWSGGPPILWETMIFGGPFDGHQLRYTTRLDALTGHARTEELVEAYRQAPRRTKWALRKAIAPYRPGRGGSWVLRPGERRRAERSLRRLNGG